MTDRANQSTSTGEVGRVVAPGALGLEAFTKGLMPSDNPFEALSDEWAEWLLAYDFAANGTPPQDSP
jgi:hypothetical protein